MIRWFFGLRAIRVATAAGLLALLFTGFGCSSRGTLELKHSEQLRRYEWIEEDQSGRAPRMMPVPADVVVVPAVATSVRPAWLKTPSIVTEDSVAVFKVEPGYTIPGHPQASRIRLRYDYFNLGRLVEIGRPATFRFTSDGEFFDIRELSMEPGDGEAEPIPAGV